MNIVKEDKGKLNALLKVQISKEDYLPPVDKSIKTLSKQVDIKGFRKGNVPVSVVKKRYGNQVLADELNKMLDAEIGKYLKENEVEILGSPIPDAENNPSNISLKDAQDFEFVYELGLSPDFELNAIDGKTKVEKYKVAIDDSMIDEELDRIKNQFGETENPETGLKEGDSMEVKLEELDDEGNVKEGGVTNESAHIHFDDVKKKALQKDLSKLKLNESVDVDIYKDFDKEHNAVDLNYLSLENGAPEGMNTKFKLTLNRIDRKLPAEFNQELFDKLFGKDQVKSLDELKEKISSEIEKAFEQSSEAKLNQDIYKMLIDKTDIELPDDFLKRWIKLSNDKPITDEQIENEYEGFAQNLKWSLISNKVAKEQDIKVTEDEMREKAKEMILQQFGGMDPSMIEEEQLNSWADSLVLKNKEQSEQIYQQLNEQKLFSYISEQLKVTDKEISLEEFKKLNEQ